MRSREGFIKSIPGYYSKSINKVEDKIIYFIVFFFVFSVTFILLSCDRKKQSNEHNILRSFTKEDYLGSTKKDSLKIVISGLTPSNLKNNLLFDISYHYYQQKDSAEFLFWNQKTFDLSKELKDTLRIAEAHWDLANFYFQLEKSDSAFYHYRRASQLYKQKGDSSHYAGMLLNIGMLQRYARDFSKSEATTLEALKIVIREDDKRRMYIGYNSLALLFNELSEYSNSLVFHEKALQVARELNQPNFEAATLNNMGLVHSNLQQYSKAMFYYERAMAIDSLKVKDRQLYAMLLGNHAYATMKIDPKAEVMPQFIRSLKIREDIGHRAGIATNKNHIGEYLLLQGDTVKAEEYLLSAKKIAEEYALTMDLLNALRLLSKIDPVRAQEAFESYVALNDSLKSAERAVQVKFARIELQTDEYRAKNEQLSRERPWIVAGSGSVIGLLFFTFVFWRQRTRNRKLQLEHEQEKINGQIYNLMLSQENKIEEGRRNEKKRISRELHDGVLSVMYGIRFNLSSLVSRTDETSTNNKKRLLDHLKNVEEEIRNISRGLQKEGTKDIGFVQLVQNYCSKQEELINIKGEFYSDPSIAWRDISIDVQMNLFRIIQEAIQNIRRHSRAEDFSVELRKTEEEMLQLLIKDSGAGFNPDRRTKGIGLKNIQERVEQMAGIFKIVSGVDGTKLDIILKT